MVDYVCDVCSKVFKQKGHYNTHKARKRPCKKDTIMETLIEKKVNEVLAKKNIMAADVVDASTVSTVSAASAASAASTVINNTKEEPCTVDIIKPFMKWVGGKTQILNEVMELFPKTMNNYHEPFLGGGSVLLSLLSHIKSDHIKVYGKIYASDLNSNIIGLYINIQKHPERLIDAVHLITEEFSTCETIAVNRKATTLEEALTSPESYYFWIRSQFNALSKEDKMTVRGSAMLLFMNKTCFRGVYREGPNGFNVPFGNYKNPSILDEQHIRTVSHLIKDVVFTARPFTDSLTEVVDGDFIYLDPPYAPESTTSFVGYTADGFTIDNHHLLFDMCKDISKKGARLLMSNADVALVKDSFLPPLYTTKIVSCRRAINSKNPESKTNEVLITN